MFKQNAILAWLLVTATALSAVWKVPAQLVEAGEVVDVTVSANAYDTRNDTDKGCPPAGCKPENTRDGDSTDFYSRWSCSREEVVAQGGADGEECKITYEFSEAVFVDSMDVALWKGDQRTRSISVLVNGAQFTKVESGGYTSSFENFELGAPDVLSLALESFGLPAEDYLSIIEVCPDIARYLYEMMLL